MCDREEDFGTGPIFRGLRHTSWDLVTFNEGSAESIRKGCASKHLLLEGAIGYLGFNDIGFSHLTLNLRGFTNVSTTLPVESCMLCLLNAHESDSAALEAMSVI